MNESEDEAMQKVTDKNYDEIVAGSGLAVVLDFGATWCATCETLDPILEEISGEKGGRVLVGKVDIGESPSLAQKLEVLGVPTVVFLRDGKPVYQFTFTGAVTKDKISQMLAQHLGV